MREQQVMCNGSLSRPVSITSGSPQGSCLSTLIFLLVIDSIQEAAVPEITYTNKPGFPPVPSSWVGLYADDTRVATVIKNIEDAEKNQDTLDRLSNWTAEDALLKFNREKFETLKYGMQEELKSEYTYIVEE